VAVEAGVAVNAAIYIQVSHDESIRRLLGRASREGRADDKVEIIEHRLEVVGPRNYVDDRDGGACRTLATSQNFGDLPSK